MSTRRRLPVPVVKRTEPSGVSLPSLRMKFIVAPGWALDQMVDGPPRSTSTHSTVSSRRKADEPSKNDKVGGGKIGLPISCTETNGESLPEGKPRTSMLAPDWPPVDSAYTPGTSFMMSAVLLGEACFSCSSLAVVIEKAESTLRTPRAEATPVTTTCWTSAVTSLEVPCSVGAALWACAAVWLTSVRTAAVTADNKNGFWLFMWSMLSYGVNRLLDGAPPAKTASGSSIPIFHDS